MRTSFAIIIISIFSLNGVAHADWKQTKWGMSIAQVQAKSPEAQPIAEDPSAQYHYNAYATDHTLLEEKNYKVGDMVYDVRYVFDDNRKLKAISMVGDQYNYIRTFNLLSGKYGAPASSTGDGGGMSNATWRVQEKHLVIKLQELMHTTLRYEPMTDAL